MEVMRMLSVAGSQITMHGTLIVDNLLCDGVLSAFDVRVATTLLLAFYFDVA